MQCYTRLRLGLKSVGCLLLLALGACAHFKSPKEGGVAWQEVVSDHFVLRTDLELPEARRRAAELELARTALIAVWPVPLPAERIAVLMPRNREELGEFALDDYWLERGFEYDGFFGDPTVVVDGSRPASEQRAVLRMLGLQAIGGTLRRSPRWLRVGLADYLETLRIDAQAGTVSAGAPHPDDANYLLRVGAAPASHVQAWSPDALTLDQTSQALALLGRCRESLNFGQLAVFTIADHRGHESPVFYGNVNPTGYEEILDGMRDRLQKTKQSCQQAGAGVEPKP